MTVNHDVVGSSPTGGVVSKKRFRPLFYVINNLFSVIWCEIFLLSKVSEHAVFNQGNFFSTLIEGSEEAKRDGL